jgi:hypothetical protein
VLDSDLQEYTPLNKPQIMQKAAEATQGIPVLYPLARFKWCAIKVVGEAVQKALAIGKREIRNRLRMTVCGQVLQEHLEAALPMPPPLFALNACKYTSMPSSTISIMIVAPSVP